MASQGNPLFWDFAAQFPTLSPNETDKSIYDKIVQVATNDIKLSTSALNLLDMALTVDFYNPRIAAFQQIIRTFVDTIDASKRSQLHVRSTISLLL